MTNRVFDLVKLDEHFERKSIAGNEVSNRIFPKYNQVINMTRGIVTKYCSDWITCSPLLRRQAIFQMNATAVALR